MAAMAFGTSAIHASGDVAVIGTSSFASEGRRAGGSGLAERSSQLICRDRGSVIVGPSALSGRLNSSKLHVSLSSAAVAAVASASCGLGCDRDGFAALRRSQRPEGLQIARYPLVCAVSGSTTAGSAAVEARPDRAKLEETIDAILSRVGGSDRGANLDDSQKQEVDGLVNILEAAGCEKPLENPLVFGAWDMIYSSNQASTGGRYRATRLMRKFLKVLDQFQSIEKPNKVQNKVVFNGPLGIRMQVVLEGVLSPIDDNTIRVAFENPKVSVGSLEFNLGNKDAVQLAITYLDDRIRIGRGARGTLIVFKRR